MLEKKKNSHNTALLLDLLHIIIGVLVAVCAVLAFLYPEQNQILFPVIFCLAAFLNGVNGWFKLHADIRSKRKKSGGLMQCGAAVFLLAAGIVSAASIWR